MNPKVQQIIEIYKQIVQNLKLEPKKIKNEENYCIIFQILFPFLEDEIENIKNQRIQAGEKINALIEFLVIIQIEYSQSNQVLNTNLSHISGPKIVQGDLKHISNFLQILQELSKLYKDKVLNPNINSQQDYLANDSNSQPSEYVEYFDNSQDEQQIYHEEENDLLQKPNKQQIQYQVINSKQRNNKSLDKYSQKKEDRKSSQVKYEQEINQQKRPIRSHSFQKTSSNRSKSQQKKPRVFTKEKYSENTQSSYDQQHTFDFDTLNISEIDYKFLQQYDEKDIEQLDENDPIKKKYIIEKKKEDVLKILQEKILQEEKNQNCPVIDNQLDIQIQNIKQCLKKLKPKPITEDIENINEQKNEYKNFQQVQLQNLQHNKSIQNQQQQNNHPRISTKIKQKDSLRNQFENVHLVMQLKLRDEKLNYLKKIHRIVFELEKRQVIDEKNDQKQARRQQNILARNILDQYESSFDDQIIFLKDKIQKQRKDRLYEGISQKSILSKLEKELKEEKIKDIQKQKEIWKYDKEKFEQLMKDDGELEKKILQIYKKY
ncbi:unnamed protein product [Paramecium pentaurelia]|uniref:DUF5745 domain-containing protein n=1 Tax=Paramecium pentaurelia TaxID=43138 RepID=A0A8S1SKT0_9CILI|nr:unnamed protein product [Paramecium pentaurelia]